MAPNRPKPWTRTTAVLSFRRLHGVMGEHFLLIGRHGSRQSAGHPGARSRVDGAPRSPCVASSRRPAGLSREERVQAPRPSCRRRGWPHPSFRPRADLASIGWVGSETGINQTDDHRKKQHATHFRQQRQARRDSRAAHHRSHVRHVPLRTAAAAPTPECQEIAASRNASQGTSDWRGGREANIRG